MLTSLRITDIQTTIVNLPVPGGGFYPAWIPGAVYHQLPITITKVSTDQGLTGVGMAQCYDTEVKDFIDRTVKPLVLSRLPDPFAADQFFSLMAPYLPRARRFPRSAVAVIEMACRLKPWRGEPVQDFRSNLRMLKQPFRAFSIMAGASMYTEHRPWSVEIAMWDIVGKALGKPVCELLHPQGQPRKRVPVYLSTGSRMPAEARADFARKYVEQEITAIKLRLASLEPEADIAMVRAVREAVGGRMEIMADAVMAWKPIPPLWDLKVALRMAEAMEELGVDFLEEPLPGAHFGELSALGRQVRQKGLKLKIAGGEVNVGRSAFETFDRHGIYDIFQPDANYAGGFSEGMRIAKLARDTGRELIPHAWGVAFQIAANLHFAAAVAGRTFLEWPHEPPTWTEELNYLLVKEPIRIENGFAIVPDKPGLGLELDEAMVRKYAVV